MSTNQPEKPAPMGFRQLFTRRAMRTLFRSPRWFFLQLRQGPEFLLDRPRDTGAGPFRDLTEADGDAVAAVAGLSAADYERAVADLWMPPPRPDEPLSIYNAREELLRIVGGIVRLTKPERVVETGVAFGFSSATILRAMADNGTGHLFSVDLPPIQYDPEKPIGQVVPDELRDRWTLRLGDSRKLLAPLVAEAAPIDVFIHDSLHTYASQLREYRVAWPHLRSGGILISDDVANPAFGEFAEEVGAEPHYVYGSAARSSVVGLLRKP
jgi:predicted O-methyltransferase YrrM